MFQKYLIYFIFLVYSSSLLAASGNVRHKPKDIFEITASGHVVINPKRTTGIHALHAKEHRGKKGKIAIVDKGIHPEIIGELRSSIHPNAFRHQYVLTPGEKSNDISMLELEYALKVNAYNALPHAMQLITEDKHTQETSEIIFKIERKRYLDRINNCDQQTTALHGTTILRLMHQMAPQSQLFPFDIEALLHAPLAHTRHTNLKDVNPYVIAVEEAIRNQVDVISFSCVPIHFSRELLNILKAALHKGITMIFAAGNYSQKNQPVYLDKEMLDDGTYIKAGIYQLFEETNGKGMLFAGSLTYNPANGEEQYSNFSQHPTRDTLNHYILAPGENLSIKNIQNQHGIYTGTSLSAPITAASFAILKDYASAKGLSCTTNELLNILQKSGHKLRHNVPGVIADTAYNVLNLPNAVHLAEKILGKKQPTSGNTQPPVKRPLSSKATKTVVKKKHITHSKKRAHPIKKQKASQQTRRKDALAVKRRAAATRKAEVLDKRRTIREAKKKAILRRKSAKKKNML